MSLLLDSKKEEGNLVYLCVFVLFFLLLRVVTKSVTHQSTHTLFLIDRG